MNRYTKANVMDGYFKDAPPDMPPHYKEIFSEHFDHGFAGNEAYAVKIIPIFPTEITVAEDGYGWGDACRKKGPGAE